MGLLAVPDTVTTRFPVVAPDGTVTWIAVSLQELAVAVVPLNLTVLLPCVAPKPLPLIEIELPIPPVMGKRLEIPGPETIVKFTPLLTAPPTVTTTLPLVAPCGTYTPMELLLQFVTPAAVKLNV